MIRRAFEGMMGAARDRVRAFREARSLAAQAERVEQLKALQEVAQEGAELKTMQNCAGWGRVVAKARIAKLEALAGNFDDPKAREKAVEAKVLEDVIRWVDRAVREGEDARRTLSTMREENHG